MAFNLRSGNNIVGKNGKGVLFKKMGSSPAKEVVPTTSYDPDMHGVAGPDPRIDPKTADIIDQIDYKNKNIITYPNTKTKKYTVNMADLPHGSQERADEYDRRGWAHDSTTYGHKDYKMTTPEVRTITLPETKVMDEKLETPTVVEVPKDKTTEDKTKEPDLTTLHGRNQARKVLNTQYKEGKINRRTYMDSKARLRRAGWKSFTDKLSKFLKGKKGTLLNPEDKEKQNKNQEEVVINKKGGKQESEITGPTS